MRPRVPHEVRDEGIETALGPDKLVAGGRYPIDFAVDGAIAKLADHLPLERQVRQMARDGLDVDSSTLWEQTWLLSRHLVPTSEANHAHVLSSDVIAVDETWWRLMKKGASKRWWVWSVAREDAVSYCLLPSRSTDAARTVLSGGPAWPRCSTRSSSRRRSVGWSLAVTCGKPRCGPSGTPAQRHSSRRGGFLGELRRPPSGALA